MPSYWARASRFTERAADRRQKWTRAGTCSSSMRIWATATVSAEAGMPGRPSRVATTPSWTQPSWARCGSSGWTNTVRSWEAAYSSARRRTRVSCTGRRALLTPTQPARLSSAISASWVPSRPTVSAPRVTTRAAPAASARWWMSSTTAAVSTTGWVSGGMHRVVMPPAAAAAHSEAMVALCSWPGSRRRAARSTSPGATTRPPASRVCSGRKPSGGAGPTATMRPSAMKTSAGPSRPLAGSTTRPPVMARVVMPRPPPGPGSWP